MPVNSPTRLLRLLTILASVTVLIGCGNGRGPEPVPGTPQPSLTGSFVDSPVSGVTWKTSGGRSGVTNDAGEFEYTQPEAGTFVETVTFSIGDIVLGTVPGIPFRGDRLYVTAVELTNSFAPTDRAATNMLVFIQSIDEDEDPTNGITISAATQAAAVGQNLDFDSPNFATEVAAVVAAIAPGNRVVTDTEALDHFYTTYAALGGTDTFDFPFPGYPPVGEGSADFQLVFADEFNTGDAPNPEVWNIDLGYGPNDFGWGNDEWQLYTDSPDNLRVEDGNLVITALCPVEPCGVRDGTITSARITTNDKFEFRYGKVVARIKPPVGKGTWPAFWALGKDFPDVQWPRVGEIDFMEVFNNTNNDDAQSAAAEKTATSAMHWCDETRVPNPNANCFVEGGRVFVDDKLELSESLNNDFQIWEADWNADRVIISINGVEYFELDIDPRTMEEFRREFFLLLNVAMGGTLGSGGTAPTGDETYPQTMLVDYVRVFQQVDDISPPELTEVTIASNNADPAFATTGDVVTVSLTANEPIVSPIVTIGGSAATTVTGSGADWQASRVIAAGDDTGGNPIAFTIDYDDLAGNQGVTVSETSDSSSVTVDTIAPELTEVMIASSNADDSLATTGDTVTVTLTASEPIVDPVVTIGGSAATTVTGSGRNWQASRAMTAGDDTGAEPIAFTIDYADFAGNVGVSVTDTTDASSVTVDTVAPTVQILGVPADFSNLDPFAVSFQFSEPVIGFDVTSIVVTDEFATPNGVARDLEPRPGNPLIYDATVTPTGFGDLVIGVEAGAASDAAGNESGVSEELPPVSNVLNADAPLLSPVRIRSTTNPDPDYAKEGDSVRVTFTATEPITPPTVLIANQAATVTDSGDSTTWTATLTGLTAPPVDQGPIAFAISGFTAVDDGTAGYATSVPVPETSQTVIFDSIRPTLAIEGLPAEIVVLEPILVTFRFSEDVIGFEAGDVAAGLVNGSVGALVGVDGAVYTAEITPDGAGDLTVAIADGAATDLAGNNNEAASETVTVAAVWSLVWADDFEVTDPSLLVNWTLRTSDPGDCPDPCDGQQEYRTDQVTVVDGVLTIEAADETGFGDYVSGIIDTRDKRALRYGRVEIDAVMPGNRGTLPSLRLLPAIPAVYGPWPQSGEIDIVNAPNLDADNTLEHTLRYGLPEPEDTATTATSDAPGTPTIDTIQYAVEWADGEIRWFVDGVHKATQTKDTSQPDRDNWYAYFEDADGVYRLGTNAGQPAAPFDQDFYVVIGLGVGDNPDSFFPQTLKIDEVRVYECVNPAVPSDINACLTGDDNLPPVVAPSGPYVETVEVYTDGPAMLDFEEPGGGTTPGTLAPAALGDATFEQPSDGGNIVWRVNVTSSGGVAMSTGDPARFIDLSGGGTAGEVLFRMRVNSASANAVLSVGLDDRGSGTGRVTLDDVAAQGVWRNYSVKIADILVASSLDIADIEKIFVIEASGGAVELDLDDISVKVACRDDGGCEATPVEESPPVEPDVQITENFDSLDPANPDALGNTGWIVFGTVFDSGGNAKFGYGPNPAPNNPTPPAWSGLVTDQGGVEQGANQLSVFSDYECCAPDQGHRNGTDLVESNIFQEFTIGAAGGAFPSVGTTVIFSFDAKKGLIAGATTAVAFIKTIDPGDGFAQTNFVTVDTTNLPDNWMRYSVSLDMADPLLTGQLLQIGFASTTMNFEPSSVFYDNIEVATTPSAP